MSIKPNTVRRTVRRLSGDRYESAANGFGSRFTCIFSKLILHHSLNVFLPYSGKMTYDPSGDPDNPEEIFEGMACGEISVLGGFTLTADDPLIYTDKVPIIQQIRHFPDQQYPPGADPDPLLSDSPSVQAAASSGTDQVASTSTGATSATGSSLPVLPTVDTAMKDLQEQLIRHHASLVKMCQKVGIKDICSINQRSKLDVLSSIGPKDLSCKICKKKLSNKQHLREHLRSQHFGKTDHYCAKCDKYFSSSSLAVHNKSHDPNAPKFTCPTCNKSFTKESRLREHLPVHQGKQLSCQYCGKKDFTHQKGLKEHERGCKKNANRDHHICRICKSEVGSRIALKRHMDTQHDGAPIYLLEEDD